MTLGEIKLGKKEEQREARKIQILKIALDQFILKGFYGTSTRKIGEIAGVSSGLMFHYFSSKEALYESLIELGCSKMNFDFPEGGSPIETFAQKVKETLDMMRMNPLSAKMFVFMGYAVYNAGDISSRAGEMLAKHDITKLSVPIIKRGQRLGEIRQGDPLALAIAFWCSIQGIAEAIALDQESPVPEPEWIVDILREKKGDSCHEKKQET